MLTEAQKQELVALAQSLESQGKSQQEVQAAIDSRKAEMLGENTVKKATSIDEIAAVNLREPGDIEKEIEQKQKEADKKYIFKAKKGTIPGNLDFEGEYVVSKKDLLDNKDLNIKTEEDLQKYLEYQFKQGKFVNEYFEDPFLTTTGQEAKAQVLSKEEEKAAKEEFKTYYESPKTTVFGAMPDPETGEFSSKQLLEADAYKRSFLDKAEEDLKVNKAADEIISNNEIYNLAEEYYIKDIKNKKFSSNIEDIAKKSENRVELLKEEGKKAKGLSELGNLDAKNALIKNQVIAEEATKLKDYIGRLNNVVLKDQKELEEYEAIKENTLRKASYINQEFKNADKELQKAIEKSQSADEINDIIRRDYGTASNIMGRAIASTYELAAGAVNIPAYIFSGIEGGIDAITKEDVNLGDFEKSGLKLGELLSGTAEELREGLSKDKTIEELQDLGDIGTWFGNLVGNQLPILGTLAATGGTAGLWAMGATTAGNKYAEMMAEIDKNPLISYSRGQLFAAPAIVGTAEALSERVTFNQLNVLKSAFKKSPSFKDAVRNYVKGITAKGVAGDIVQEGGSEVLAQASENLVDAFMLDKDISLDRGLMEAFASGAAMSAGVFKAPLIFKQVFNPFRFRDTELEIARGNQIIESLNQEMSKLNEGNPADRKQLEYLANAVNEVKAKQIKYLAKDLNNIDNLTEEQKQELITINGEIGKIRNEAGQIDANVRGKDAKELAFQPLNERYNELAERKNTILQSANEAVYDAPSLERSTLENYQAKGLTQDFYLNKRVELLTNEITNLEKLKEGVKDPERLAMLNLKIKNRQAQLAYSVPAAMGMVDTNINATGLKAVSLEFVNKSKDLLSQLQNKQITQKQYDSLYKQAKDSYTAKRAKLATAPKEFSKLQSIYDKYFTEANQRVKGGKFKSEVDKNRAAIEFREASSGIVEAITKRLYDRAPDAAKENYSRDDFKNDVQSEIFELIQTEFDPSKQTLDKFISSRENLRAQRMANKQMKQVFDSGISEAADIVSDTMNQEMEADQAQEQIDSAKALGIEFDSSEVEKELLKNYDVDSKSFKKNISSGFITKFKDKVYDFIGKDTKNNKAFTEKLKSNPKAFYDILTVEGMRMARGKDGSNPFEEAGMLIFKDGQLEKVAFENINIDDFVNYFTDASLAKQARSNRQNRFKEAVTVSVAASQAVKILNTNEDLKNRIVDLNQLKADVAANLSPFQKDFNVSENEFATYDKDWSKYAGEFDYQDYDLNNDTQRKEFLSKLKSSGLTKLLPASFFLNFNGVSKPKIFEGEYVKTLDGKLILQKDYKKLPKGKRPSVERARSGNVFFMNVAEAQAWVAENGPFAEEKESYSWIKKQKTAYGKIVNGKKQLSLKENFKDKEWIKNEDNKLIALEDIFTIFQNFMVKDGAVNKENAALVAALLKSTSSWQGHFVRKASPVKFTAIGKMYDENNKPLFDEEHTLPASAVAKYLFSSAINGNIKKDFKNVKKNFFQGPLLKEFDSRLAGKGPDGRGFNYKARTPSGWLMTDNIWARYFNPNVNNVRGGIDPNKIILRNGKSVAEEFNVGFDGKVTADVLKAQQEGIAEQTDKVEFIIDRAIAKLTELTGTKGLAVDPFLLLAAKDVSLNVLVGGLRTIKTTYKAGKSLAKAIDAGYQSVKKYMTEREWLEFAKLATQEIEDVMTPARARLAIYNEAGVAAAQENIRKEGEKLLRELGIDINNLSTDEINNKLSVLSKARAVAMNKKAPTKKARVFDFDDTLAQSKSNVLYLLPDGTTGTLSATEFAEQSGELAELGAQFDFSEFATVKEGTKGPLAVLAKKLTEAKGDRDVFVLTARPAAAAESIQSFLRSALGISIPLENITGLGDGTPGAKAYWMAEKVSEGYNDMFFADDAPQNVAAVNKMLTDLGVKKKVQIAKEAESPSLEDGMDNILRSKKPTKGSIFRRFNIYVPPGADDFEGLLYTFLSKGKLGESQMKFFQDNIMTPFAQGISAYETAKVTLARDYKALRKRYKNKALLKEKVINGLYNNEQAVRAYLYNGAGYDLNISKADEADLISIVQGNPELKAFADDLAKITKISEGYPPITPDWLGGSIQTDLANVSNKAQRKEFLTEFINNKNQIFSDQNMKLILQMHGNDFTDALKNVLERMETGVNRKKGKDKEFNQAMNWINGSVANIMAFNTRSAILQQLSAINFMNWTFNNPFMMAKAMANVPQFAKDFGVLFNSDFLLERRGGLKIEINTADLANSEPNNWFLKSHKKLLQAGFLPTQWGDSFAIAFGGASWYRNNINKLLKEGVSESDAIKQTMIEFQEIAEKSQQSSRPDKVSRQQASEIGRFILAFANTPMQYARLTKKAALDLANGRGDWKTNASKLVYYGVAQNLIFTALQSALFSMFLDDEDEVTEDDEKKLTYALNSILDGTLRGMGYAGATIAALKNFGMELYNQNQKRQKGERVYNGSLTLIQKGLTISPPISKKIGDIVEAQRYQDWRQYKYSPFYQNYAYANYVSGILNIPADRLFKKLENINAMSTEYNDAWQNVLLGLGWSPYSVDVDLVDIRKKRIFSDKNTPLDKKDALEPGVLGKAHKDGTIQVKEGLSPAKKKEVIAHEKKHLADMKSGKLNYDNQNVYWKGKAYPRLQGKKIMYDGVAYMEGAKQLPWEKSANGIKV